MAFMNAYVTSKQYWYDVDTNVAGSEFVPEDLIGRILQLHDAEDTSAVNPVLVAKLRDYVEGSTINDVRRVYGYGVRLSADGYLDCTSWEVYTSKREAMRRARELQRESEGQD